MRLKPFSFTPAIRLSLLYSMAQDLSSFDEFKSLRVHIESAYWVEACETLTEADKATMREQLNAARQKLANTRWIQIPHEEHRAFHLTVFKNLENPFVVGLLEAYWDAYEAVELNRYADYTYHQDVWDYHEQILGHIEAENYEAARVLFVEHTSLLRVQPRMQHLATDTNDDD
jgi:DNA-binding GntR family transcriptional regulator